MPRSRHSDDVTTIEKSRSYDTLMPLLNAMFREFQESSKKKPDAVVGKLKLSMVNKVLGDSLLILEGESSRDYLDVFDEDDLPQNSDVVLMLGQVVAAMQAFRDRYYGYIERLSTHGWATPENQ
jgi:hypothetical protein